VKWTSRSVTENERDVPAGIVVSPGDVIGMTGQSGDSSSTLPVHLHIEVQVKSSPNGVFTINRKGNEKENHDSTNPNPNYYTVPSGASSGDKYTYLWTSGHYSYIPDP